MAVFFLALFIAFISAMLIVKSSAIHGSFTNDSDLVSTQKFHKRPVPRIGGLALVIAMLVTGLMKFSNDAALWGKLLIASSPAFIIGILEDVVKRVSPRIRLVVTSFSAILVFYFVQVHFTRVDSVWFDNNILSIPLISLLFMMVIVNGIVHAANVIDGFHGLMLGVSLLVFLSLALVSYNVGDNMIMNFSLVAAGSVAGLFLVNFPFGTIFSGDCGAYFIGFFLATLSVMLMERNPQISAWFPCLLLMYPIFETLFSMYRKVIIRKITPIQPDGVHLHMLIYKRVTLRNAKTSLYLWMLSLVCVIPAVLFWRSTATMLFFILVFGITYLHLYWSLVRFQKPYHLLRSSRSL